MSRHDRKTVPLDTKLGVLDTYEAQEPHLIEAEWRGRKWAFRQSQHRRALTDSVVLDLHEAMFGELLEWAGCPRSDDRGPGGKVPVPHHRVREELRKLCDDFAAWVAAAGVDPTIEQVATALADTHHRLQWIHPFADTNGRTGRALDHFILWSCFGLASKSIETSPVLVYFPDEGHEDAYYNGLVESDLHRPEALRAYFLERLERALSPVFTVHWWDGVKTTACVAIHDHQDAAIADARARSARDPAHLYRVLGEGSRVVARAIGGKIVDEDGDPAPDP